MKRSMRIVLSLAILAAFISTSLGLTSIAVKSIKLNASSVTIEVGKTYRLKVTITPENATNKNIVYSSANKKIASVDKNGNIKGIITGKTVITATSTANRKAVAKCSVIVTQKIQELKFSLMKSKITSATTGDPFGPDQEKRITKALEKYMGMKIKINWIYRDRESIDWPTFFASMDWPDAFYHFAPTNSNESINKLGEDGLLVNLLKYDIPYYSESLKDNYNKLKVLAGDGGIYNFAYGFYTSPQEAGSTQWTWVWRMDIFQKHNLKIPATLDELYTVSKKLKELYPKSFPMGSYVAASWYSPLRVLLMINKTAQGIYYNGKEYVFGPTYDEAKVKATLMYLNKFYKEGLLDPEFLTQTGDQSRQKAVDGTYIYMPNHFAGNIKTFNSNTVYTDVKYGFAENPKGFDGSEGWKISSNKKGAELFGYGLAINKKAPNPNLLVKLFDYFYSPEMREVLDYGDLGVHYTKDASGKITVFPETLKGATNWDTRKGVIKFDCGLNDGWGTSNLVYAPDICYANGKYFNATWLTFTNKYYTDDSIFPDEKVPNVVTTSDDKSLRDTNMGPITTYVDEYFNKFITGEISFSKWDEFIGKVKSMGNIKAVLDMMNKNLDKLKNK